MASPTSRTYRTITNQHGFSPDLLEGLADPLVQAVHNVEQEIIIKVTQEAIKPQAKKGGLRRRLTRFTKRLFNRLIKRAKTTEQEATTIGTNAATVLTARIIPPQSPPKVELPTAPKPPLNPEQGVTVRIPKALHETITELIPQVSKSGNQLYDQIVEAIAKNPPNSEAGRRRVAQQLLDTFNKKGITGFVDKAGRNWNLVSYVEMATRTATTALAREAHVKQLTKLGLDVVRVTVMPDCNPLCLPFQGRLLSLTGRVKKNYHGEEVVATLAEALIRGYNHPNAVLGGDQKIDTLAGSVGASKSAYTGPAITIRTANGNSVTVSPEHPVLTHSGWRTAESVSVGDDLARTVDSGRTASGSLLIEPNVNDMVTTVQEEFDALKMVFPSKRVPTTGNNFQDDRKFLQGEVDVVVSEACLLPIPDPQVIKESGKFNFVWPDMAVTSGIGNSTSNLSFNGVSGFPVSGSLANANPVSQKDSSNGAVGNSPEFPQFLASAPVVVQRNNLRDVIGGESIGEKHTRLNQAVSNRRVGDLEEFSAISLGISREVKLDKVISVDRVQFSGHAYDFQTVDGIYSVDNLILHNCRHTVQVVIPGKEVKDPDLIDPGDYQATQHLRRLERDVRAAKRAKETALTTEARHKAQQQLTHAQQKIRTHIHKTGISRKRLREQIKLAL